ncbi:MAG: hypothetical protein NT031_06560, partial [Planctomycetota bacterium]|nr:hypothetical protein [Planctomycetota bacterium]
QRPVKDAGDTRGSGPYPPSDFWPGIPGTMVADWNLFICPAETKLATNNSVPEFHSQEGWSVPFGPSDCCQVHVGPGPAWGGGSDCPPTPVGATDYGFEDVGGPNSTYKGDADFNDAVIRIYDGADEAFLIAGSAAYSNSIWSNGKLLYQIPSIWGRVNPPVRFQLPEGKTNYGYNAAVAGVGADAAIVALDYPFATIDTTSDDVPATIALHPELGLRHQNKVNVLKADGSVWRARISEVDPTTAEIKKLWGIK